MPVYEYECNGCRKVFEMQQRIADAPLSVCPECGGNVKKLISMSSFQLKGGGWYTDGYSCGGNGKGAEAGASASSVDTGASPACPGGGGSCCHCPAVQ
jgi:putative FmdB family regulatory protein